VTEQPEGWRDQLARYARAVVTEAVLPAAEKLIPQGASEMAQALYAGNAFVPYGPTNAPIEMGSPDLSGSAAQQPATYEAELRTYATVDPEKQQSRGMEAASLYGPATAAEATRATDYESELSRYVSRAQEPQQLKENER
jgi:hypothetical protein